MTYLRVALMQRLNDHEAKGYAARLHATGRIRVTVFTIGFGVSNVELRPLPGQPWRETVTLRTPGECEAALERLTTLEAMERVK